MPPASSVVEHYGQESPIDRIKAELVESGFDLDQLKPDDVAGVDEFHLGGRAATTELLKSMDVGIGDSVLDVGCGIGGVSRTIASATGASVTGVDITPAFVEAAGDLSTLLGLDDLTTFEVADAVALRFEDGQFDAITLVHVGMNIADKAALFAELARVLRLSGSLHVYDIMRIGEGDVTFPVPWSSGSSTSFVDSPEVYVDAMAAAALTVSEPVSRVDLVQAAIATSRKNPPSVNLSHLMGSNWSTMMGNMLASLDAGTLAPVEIVARR